MAFLARTLFVSTRRATSMMTMLGAPTVLLSATLRQKSSSERFEALLMHLPDSLSPDFPSHLTPVIPEQWFKHQALASRSRLSSQHAKVICSSHYLQCALYLRRPQITRMAQFKSIISLFCSLSLTCALGRGLNNGRVIVSCRN